MVYMQALPEIHTILDIIFPLFRFPSVQAFILAFPSGFTTTDSLSKHFIFPQANLLHVHLHKIQIPHIWSSPFYFPCQLHLQHLSVHIVIIPMFNVPLMCSFSILSFRVTPGKTLAFPFQLLLATCPVSLSSLLSPVYTEA